MNSIFRKLRKAGIRRRSLYLAWDFTVASERNLTERVLHMRDDAFALLGDTDLADGVVQGNAPGVHCDQRHSVNNEPGVGMRIEGTFQVPCYLDSAGCEPGGGFRYASKRSNIPVRSDTANFRTAPFYCNVPSAASPANPRAQRAVRAWPARRGRARSSKRATSSGWPSATTRCTARPTGPG